MLSVFENIIFSTLLWRSKKKIFEILCEVHIKLLLVYDDEKSQLLKQTSWIKCNVVT